MSTIYLLASQTLSLKFRGWDVESAVVVTTVAYATDFDCFCSPDFVVPVFMSCKSMGDFVKNCVSNFGGSVQIGQHTAYGNLPLAPVAATKTSHRSVESKTPLRSQAMLGHQLFGKDFSFTEIHVIILLCVSPSERHDTNKLVKVTAGDESTCQHWHGP